MSLEKENPIEKGYRAIVFGGTGATGRWLVKFLVQNKNFSKVLAIVRNQQPLSKYDLVGEELESLASKKLEQFVVDFDNLSTYTTLCNNYHISFNLMGTTRAKAGSAEAFKKVDYHYVLQTAILSKNSNVPFYSLMTSTGADSSSWLLYKKTKGQIEAAINELKFPIYSIFRPGLLLTPREEQRTIEAFAQKVGVWLGNSLSSKNAPIDVKIVAQAMLNDSLTKLNQYYSSNNDNNNTNNINQIFENDQIRTLGTSNDISNNNNSNN